MELMKLTVGKMAEWKQMAVKGMSSTKNWGGQLTEEVLEWFSYPRASAHPRCEVSSQWVPNRPILSLRSCSTEASPMVEKLYCAKSGLTCSIVANLPKCLSLVVHKFCTADKEHCEQGYGQVCANL